MKKLLKLKIHLLENLHNVEKEIWEERKGNQKGDYSEHLEGQRMTYEDILDYVNNLIKDEIIFKKN